MKAEIKAEDGYSAYCFKCQGVTGLEMVAHRNKGRMVGWWFVCHVCRESLVGSVLSIQESALLPGSYATKETAQEQINRNPPKPHTPYERYEDLSYETLVALLKERDMEIERMRGNEMELARFSLRSKLPRVSKNSMSTRTPCPPSSRPASGAGGPSWSSSRRTTGREDEILEDSHIYWGGPCDRELEFLPCAQLYQPDERKIYPEWRKENCIENGRASSHSIIRLTEEP